MHIHYFGEGALLFDNNKKIYVGKNELNAINNKIKKYKSLNRENIKSNDKLILNTESIEESGRQGFYYPELINLFITNKCPQNCIHCFNDSDMNASEMEFKDIIRIINMINKKTPQITLTGGEPLVHKDFLNIVDSINGFDYKSIVTSLNISNIDIVKSLENFNEIQISIYGHDRFSHDNFTKNVGAFDRVWKNIKKLSSTNTNITISSMNNEPNKLEDIVKLAIDSGVKKIQFGELVNMGRAKINENKLCFKKIEPRIIFNLKSKYRNYIDIIYDEGCLTNSISVSCGAGISKLDIDSNGFIYPCILSNQKSSLNILDYDNFFENNIFNYLDGVYFENIFCKGLENNPYAILN